MSVFSSPATVSAGEVDTLSVPTRAYLGVTLFHFRRKLASFQMFCAFHLFSREERRESIVSRHNVVMS